MDRHHSTQKTLGLVLGGGGARGLAHIGVLKVLEQSNIKVSAICGCSIGGLIGAFYASGINIDQIEEIAQKYSSVRELLTLIDRTPSRRGLFVGKRVRKFISDYISPSSLIENTRIPLKLNSVDLKTSKEVVLDHGNLLNAVMASAAVPGFFAPVEIGNFRLVDGGVMNNVPVSLLSKNEVDVILAVDVHDYSDESVLDTEKLNWLLRHLPDILLYFFQAEIIMVSQMTKLNLEKTPPDLLVQPIISPDISAFLGFQKAEEIIRAGKEKMGEMLPALMVKLTII